MMILSEIREVAEDIENILKRKVHTLHSHNNNTIKHDFSFTAQKFASQKTDEK
jgi:hypothetical protein